MQIGVFCSARELAPEFVEPVRDFAKHVGEHGHTLVWGGSGVGLMKVVAEGVRGAGGRLVGVSIEPYASELYEHADEMVHAKDLFDRKRIMIERSDGIVILPGGIGTLDELTDILEMKREGLDIPLVVLNTSGVYDNLQEEFEVMADDGLLDRPVSELVKFARTPHECLDILIEEAGLNRS